MKYLLLLALFVSSFSYAQESRERERKLYKDMQEKLKDPSISADDLAEFHRSKMESYFPKDTVLKCRLQASEESEDYYKAMVKLAKFNRENKDVTSDGLKVWEKEDLEKTVDKYQGKFFTLAQQCLGNEKPASVNDKQFDSSSCEWVKDVPRRKVYGNSCGTSSMPSLCVGYVVCKHSVLDYKFMRLSTCSADKCGDRDAAACTAEKGFGSIEVDPNENINRKESIDIKSIIRQ